MDSAACSAHSANGVSAMADSVPPVAEEAEIRTVTGRPAETQRVSRRVAAARRNAARVRDDSTLNQAMACIHRGRWIEAMLDSCTPYVSTLYSSSVSRPLVVGR